MRAFLASLFGAALLAAPASAGVTFETESNDSFEDANFLGNLGNPGGGFTVDGTITNGDVDWFRINLLGDSDFFSVALFSLDNPIADGQLQIVRANGAIVAFDDDSGIGLMPTLGLPLAAGQYFIGVSQFADIGFNETGLDSTFDGLDNEGFETEGAFTYKLVIGAQVGPDIPAPAAAGTLALAAAAGLRRRRR